MPGERRASTSYSWLRGAKDVDARVKPAHDDAHYAAFTRLKPFHSAVAAPDISTGM